MRFTFLLLLFRWFYTKTISANYTGSTAINTSTTDSLCLDLLHSPVRFASNCDQRSFRFIVKKSKNIEGWLESENGCVTVDTGLKLKLDRHKTTCSEFILAQGHIYHDSKGYAHVLAKDYNNLAYLISGQDKAVEFEQVYKTPLPRIASYKYHFEDGADLSLEFKLRETPASAKIKMKIKEVEGKQSESLFDLKTLINIDKNRIDIFSPLIITYIDESTNIESVKFYFKPDCYGPCGNTLCLLDCSKKCSAPSVYNESLKCSPCSNVDQYKIQKHGIDTCLTCNTDQILDKNNNKCMDCKYKLDKKNNQCIQCKNYKILKNNECESCTGGEEPDFKKNTCKACETGWISDGKTPCKKCIGGTVANAAKTECVFCTGGNMIDSSTHECKPCQDGWISDGKTPCKQCIDGTVTNAAKTECESCSRGEEPDFTTNTCKSCKDGWVSDGKKPCKQCKNDLIPNNELTDCVKKCAFGLYPNKEVCLPCPVNTFSAGSRCLKCEKGTYSIGAGSSCEEISFIGRKWILLAYTSFLLLLIIVAAVVFFCFFAAKKNDENLKQDLREPSIFLKETDGMLIDDGVDIQLYST